MLFKLSELSPSTIVVFLAFAVSFTVFDLFTPESALIILLQSEELCLCVLLLACFCRHVNSTGDSQSRIDCSTLKKRKHNQISHDQASDPHLQSIMHHSQKKHKPKYEAGSFSLHVLRFFSSSSSNCLVLSSFLFNYKAR